jgi:hypothetical protein
MVTVADELGPAPARLIGIEIPIEPSTPGPPSRGSQARISRFVGGKSRISQKISNTGLAQIAADSLDWSQ